MKSVNQNSGNFVFKIAFLMVSFICSLMIKAQNTNSKVDVTTTTTTTEWQTNPIYWVIGALVLIIIIALLARGKKKS